MANVTILGSGVIGSSVALVLNSQGHDVTLIGSRRMSDRHATSNPSFASAFPAASIIPHSIPNGNFAGLAKSSEQVFQRLIEFSTAKVRLQRHLELFEDERLVPFDRHLQRGFKRIGSDTRSEVIPIRSNAKRVYGIAFDCFFCDMPFYGKWLDEMVDQSSIRFQREKIDKSFIPSSEADAVVNCLGCGASNVFQELDAGLVYRGILLETAFDYPDQKNVSYNYTPHTSVYRNGNKTADVYFYPRTKHCILGGTRQRGRLSPGTKDFIPIDAPFDDCVDIDGITVPRPLIDLNTELIEQLTGCRISAPFKAVEGYRHVAGTVESPEIALRAGRFIDSKPVIDCFGFGGAGVTLSWGAAIETSRLIAQAISQPGTPVNEAIERLIDLLRAFQH